MMMWWSNGGWSWWGWYIGVAVMLVFWALVTWIVVTLVRSNNNVLQSRTPEDVPAERYARGDTDQDEYQRRRDTLHQSALAPPSS
jgi:putative membrane protein